MRFTFVLLLIIWLAPVAFSFADPVVTIDNSSLFLKITNGDHTLSVNLADGSLDFSTPYRDYHFLAQFLHDAGWAQPEKLKSEPIIERSKSSVSAKMVFSVAGDREFIIEASARRGVPGFVVASRLKNIGPPRNEYYFWAWNGSFDHYFVPVDKGFEKRNVNSDVWDRFGFHDGLFLPAEKGGLAIVTNGIVGRGPGQNGDPFLHALPSSQCIVTGESMDVTFAVVGARDASEAQRFYSRLRRARIKQLSHQTSLATLKGIDYGQPAPEWLRNAEVYNGFYHHSDAWNRENLRLMSDFPLIVGVPHNKMVIDRCHRAGIRVIAYVNYMELLDTEVELKANGKLYYEWTQSADCDKLDMAHHPDWACYDSKGEVVKSIWGSANGHPGLIYTCFHAKGLHEAALSQVRKIMEMGADGVFIDNSMPVVECYGHKLGKHTHADPDRCNNDKYEDLLRAIYELVKSFGKDRIVMQNSSLMPSHWAYCDAQMWEACLYGAGTVQRLTEWEEARRKGEMQEEAIRRGKVPVILSYFDAVPAANKRNAALYTYAYARIYGYLWADWFTLSQDYFSLKLADDYSELAKPLYSTCLGKPVSSVMTVGKGVYRLFEHGIAVVNPGSKPLTISVPGSRKADDLCHGTMITPKDGRYHLTLAPESGRILVYRR